MARDARAVQRLTMSDLCTSTGMMVQCLFHTGKKAALQESALPQDGFPTILHEVRGSHVGRGGGAFLCRGISFFSFLDSAAWTPSECRCVVLPWFVVAAKVRLDRRTHETVCLQHIFLHQVLRETNQTVSHFLSYARICLNRVRLKGGLLY